MESYKFSTAKGELVLDLIDEVEPNNGRMLYAVSLTLDGRDVTKEYFEDWNYIIWYLSNYTPVSPDGRHIYIPKEGDHFRIDAHTLEKTKLKELELAAGTFVGNLFLNDHLVVTSIWTVLSNNMTTNETYCITRWQKGVYFKNTEKVGSDKLKVSMSDGSVWIYDAALRPVLP